MWARADSSTRPLGPYTTSPPPRVGPGRRRRRNERQRPGQSSDSEVDSEVDSSVPSASDDSSEPAALSPDSRSRES
ncbi:hypothetical protein SAMN04490356_0967 [Streptomyces melanosporofaciens]|uniref:Uncharacterized protein n=1 Tax=Streptomyces melanosporofaciens TaxID=67327 RepID=A0A1H4KU70_STRMJ|nr:hypothetical protein SAMN04490356_0967 [Streptomyces melanosporofaciens]